ncbi:MAG: hypothetical protein ACJ8G3_16430 [Burkholderiaceae bacterium]
MSERMETNEVSPPDGLPMEQLFVPDKAGLRISTRYSNAALSASK